MKIIITNRRTPEEIAEKIEKLKAERASLPEYSFFGDPNWKIIDLQISVLEGKIKTEDEIYDMEVSEEWDFDISPILDASQWLQGNDVDFA